MTFRPTRVLLGTLIALLIAAAPAAHAAPPAPVEHDVQGFLEAQPGPLKHYHDGVHTAAEIIQATSAYYGVSPRILLALLEASSALLSAPSPPASALSMPFGAAGPAGFAAQLDWAGRELRAGLGPYQRPPVLRFTDDTTQTLSLDQAPEGVAMQRFLAKGRTRAGWLDAIVRFNQAFQQYFDNQLPDARLPQPAAISGFLQRPWAAGTRVVHLAYFDHMFPTVDTGKDDNGYVVNYLGQGNLQYDGHDGHDFYFPDQPIGTYIYAAAAGIAHASTHRGNGVWIEHPGGYVTVYWHLDKFAKKFRGEVDTGAGVPVRAGDLIGSSGKTGFVVGTPHLHFEVRHNGKQVDPYGWFGAGDDPCSQYAACEASTWLWDASLAGEFDLTPPGAAAPPDHAPPQVLLSLNPPGDLLFLNHFDGSPLPQLGAGAATAGGPIEYPDARFGQGAHVAGAARLAFATAANLNLDAGTIAFWAQVPEHWPETKNNRQYLLAASAHADEGPVYTGTLALRRDTLGADGQPRWNFWTTPERGEAGRDDLAAPDTLGPGLHHFAISWDRARQQKALYLDGRRAIAITGVELPANVGGLLELGRWAPGSTASGATFDELAIYGRALGPLEIAQLAARPTPLPASAIHVSDPQLNLVVQAGDDGGAIMGMQIGLDGLFGDPQPYTQYAGLRLPDPLGPHTVAVRLFDRAGNSTTVSTTVTLSAPPQPQVMLTSPTDLGATLVISQSASAIVLEAQLSARPSFADAAWQPLPLAQPWLWLPGQPHVAWVRFRDPAGAIGPTYAIGPDQQRLWLPVA